MLSSFRLIELHDQLSKGESLEKAEILKKFGIDAKTFQRDIDRLRCYYSEKALGDIKYDRQNNCYRLDSTPNDLSKKEVFALCKILIESRAFNNQEFTVIVDKLLKLCQKKDAKQVYQAINNERVNYLELQHGKPLIDEIWELREAISDQHVIEITYRRADNKIKHHEVKPVGIVFSEFYFYLLAFQMDETIKYPTVFRIDRIRTVRVTNRTFPIPYRQRFSEAEFKKRVQFMYSGELKKVRFEFTGILESLLDKLPTAQIEKEVEGGVIVRVESFGNGIEMWLRSQGDKVKILGKGI
ncbi:helix-turn-helix transcriptional regulator [Streptococcus saliviloxodontae]|uniref:DNA-binding transcriptional regulator YafY n=1 Tax=Streptococcus saliviloxodontae TaxID=1349416 RepID=A0ABS2PKJ3_9STRE|nr:WYL domain-containing protein [Streptococcus saliviloxodontae]MBM7635530.1 putative DNA-binding transcriptional regulator YafY [Streptococcus saliviloxodontae]